MWLWYYFAVDGRSLCAESFREIIESYFKAILDQLCSFFPYWLVMSLLLFTRHIFCPGQLIVLIPGAREKKKKSNERRWNHGRT